MSNPASVEQNRLVEENERLGRRVAELEAVAEGLRTGLRSIGDAAISVDTGGNIVQMDPADSENKRAAQQVEFLAGFPRENPNPVLRVDLGGKLLYANRSSEALLVEWGCAVGDVLPSNLRQVTAGAVVRCEPAVANVVCADRVFSVSFAPLVGQDCVNIYGLDITERVHAEATTRQQYAILCAVLQASDASIFSLDREYRYTSFNDSHAATMKAIYGVEIQIGSSLAEFQWVPDDWQTARQNLDRAMRGESFVESAFLGNDGMSRRCFEISHSPIRTSTGEIIGVAVYSRDVTERKRSEDELRASEARFREMFERSTIGKAMTASDGRLLKVNRTFADMLGLSIEELQQLNLAEISHADDLPESVHCTRALVAGQCASYRMEKRYKHRDGHWVFADTSATLLSQIPGTPGCLLASIVDITERKQTLAALTASESLTRGILENVQDAYIRADRNGRMVMVSPSAASVYGYGSTEEMLGLPTTALYALEEERLSIVEEMKHHGGVHDRTGMARKKDGTPFWVSLNARFIRDQQGRVEGSESFVRDLSKRKQAEAALRQSEQRLRRFYESGLLGVIYWNTEGQITDANDKFLEMVGYSRADLAGGKIDWVGMTPSEYKQLDEVSLAELRATGRNQAAIEKEYVRKDGTRIQIAVAGAMLDDERVNGVAFVQDISARKLAEAERLGLEGQLRVAQRMEAIGLLAGGVAHDFNNLLSVILCSTEFALARAHDDDRLRDELVEVRKAGERAVGLTRQLLAFGRRQVLQPVVLNLNQVAEGLEKMLRRILGEDIEYCQVLAPDLGAVRADPGQIEQVLMNLVVNARDAMSSGGKLTIETRNVELDEEYAARHVSVKAGPYVECIVSDTGCGMDKQTQARIFEPFFTTKETGKGTGLGLSTVYGIVKQSGGNIWVYSEPGQGTTFKVYLPRELSSPSKSTATRPAGSATRGSGAETVLVVEDEEALRGIAERILCEAGYRVLSAATAGDALQICNEHQGKIDLLLTDVVMPKMGGRVLSGRLVVVRPEAKVLYMSGYADEAIAHQGTLVRGTHFISKPFSAAELAEKVREVLDSALGNPAKEPEQGPTGDASPGEQALDAVSQVLSPSLLDRLWQAAVAARYDEVIALIETLGAIDPPRAARLRERAQSFDYDGLRRLLRH